MSFEDIIRNKLKKSGIVVGGTDPWDPQVHNSAFFRRVVLEGMLGLGDSYVEGWWDCNDLASFFDRAIRGGLLKWSSFSFPAIGKRISDTIFNQQNRKRAVENVLAHYKIRDELVLGMTDAWHAYSCAFFKDPAYPKEGLNVAQEQKLGLICQKLGLTKEHRFLDIGCGWGSLLGYAKKNTGVLGTGITPAANQAEYIQQTYGNTVIVGDYRSLTGEYDRIASVGMFEHVGQKNYRTYFETAHRVLVKDGLFLLHTFGIPDRSVPLLDTWTDRHIFPGIYTPTIAEIATAAEGLFEIFHLDEWGRHYDPTLMAWAKNFESYAEKTGLKTENPKLYRLWMYYLKSCAGAFRAGEVVLWQFVLKPRGSMRAYTFSES